MLVFLLPQPCLSMTVAWAGFAFWMTVFLLPQPCLRVQVHLKVSLESQEPQRLGGYIEDDVAPCKSIIMMRV